MDLVLGSKYTLEVNQTVHVLTSWLLLNSAGRKDEDRSSFLPEPKTWYTCLNLNLQLSDCECCGVPFTPRKLVHSCLTAKIRFQQEFSSKTRST